MILLAGMAVYYGWRLFALTPWYDELYTYYFFISRGPVYAAIHWPLPNNHVGYSVLSAVLDLFGNSYIGLRGVSYLCALTNLCLLYRTASKWMSGCLPLVTVILYLSMSLVNQMAVQGRGYTLGITCFLTAFLCMTNICTREEYGKRYYVIYAFSLTLGLYAVSSNVYWVLPLCLSGGVYLLIAGIQEWKDKSVSFFKTFSGSRFLKLVAASLAAAVFTVILYGIIWLAIGSNLLVKDETGVYYGLSHVKMILSSPFAAVKRGMEYMLDTPYIQSEARDGFLGRLGEFFKLLSGYYYGQLDLPVLIIWCAGLIMLVRRGVIKIKDRASREILPEIFLFFQIIFVPVCLFIQCKRPYYRVFTYGGAVLALLIAWMLYQAVRRRKPAGKVEVILLSAVVLFGIKCLVFSGYNAEYGDREHEIEMVLRQADIEDGRNYCVTDCNQEYLLYFLYGIRCENTQIEGADMVILDKRMMNPDFDEAVWEFYHYYDSIPWDYMEETMQKTYESSNYVLYQIK